ncbi:hypothetical protein N9205_01535 [Akkermansiaceae bacterium]|nr:hypothetical protein [Akkermansiaceae bacterium]
MLLANFDPKIVIWRERKIEFEVVFILTGGQRDLAQVIEGPKCAVFKVESVVAVFDRGVEGASESLKIQLGGLFSSESAESVVSGMFDPGKPIVVLTLFESRLAFDRSQLSQ